jgi:hypothetical protein
MRFSSRNPAVELTHLVAFKVAEACCFSKQIEINSTKIQTIITRKQSWKIVVEFIPRIILRIAVSVPNQNKYKASRAGIRSENQKFLG